MPGSPLAWHCPATSTTPNTLRQAEHRGSLQLAVPDLSQLGASSALHRTGQCWWSTAPPNHYSQVSAALQSHLQARCQHSRCPTEADVRLPDLALAQGLCAAACSLQLTLGGRAEHTLGCLEDESMKGWKSSFTRQYQKIVLCSFSKGALCWHLPWGTAWGRGIWDREVKSINQCLIIKTPQEQQDCNW